MRWVPSKSHVLLAAALNVAATLLTSAASAQDLSRVSVNRRLKVGGIGIDPHSEDLLGLSRVKFQGLIAVELTSVGYQLVDESTPPRERDPAHLPLTLVGSIKEEICDDEAPSQCRVAIVWELQDQKGVVVYRVLTRAVAQEPTLVKLRRSLVEGALRSLLERRRFALQLTDPETEAAPKPGATAPLGFKQCRRPSLSLPEAARSVAASLVFVESASKLSGGGIISGDGLILTSAGGIVPDAPLRVRFSAEQTLPAEVVALDRDRDVALLHVAAHTDTTCLPVREQPLAPGAAAFGVSSEPAEDRAISLTGSVVQKTLQEGKVELLQVDARIARIAGAPLLDDQGRLAGITSSARDQAPSGAADAVEVGASLRGLGITPAPITDPRLTETRVEPLPAVGFVRDRDDPAYVLTRRYTYGTSDTAHRVRTVAVVTTAVGAVGVAATWLRFRDANQVSTAGRNRAVVLNDLSWALFGLGAVGVGASYAWPEAHDVVAVQSARREVFVAVSAGGVTLGGRI